ncbi:crossover junction endodeoxyribonuclease RuvC [Candidatus Liberibacter solanacearum]|uniref:Crossover junction endodeoxyribonuclease RuvC n=1 Tax=Candidatus Liberibacter solanacearum TaxID=556287 RepID=A0A095BFF6_9HYPH|nr:crossover junction endodeoxyribonuclease RuvC [Candidatus Liberibacter solanacearum]KGB27553.1 Holliday junction resolvase [Candidatus Liberibacter solanacearum]KJZ80796.1 Holliday junction resolvase [Candidatus Liberibacter solanacearum]KJZ81911.1 Crossover junction endodeoxyribonuclease RuvC [Candidatus Liberibacter solanacearum]KQC49638.1 Holliday junction resolvase [Candidatus Liberibacter solanacearum]
MTRKSIRIIGIDPGLRRTGWGIIDAVGDNLCFVSSGTVVSCAQQSLAVRLRQLYEGLADIMRDFHPEEAAVEQVFVNKDAVATLKLGQARAIAILSPALTGISVSEYAPNTIKKAVIGVGHGDKRQIHMMLKMLMPGVMFKGKDAADALAIAVCHAHHTNYNRYKIES